MDFLNVFNVITNVIYAIANFTYEALFYQVNIFGYTFPLWSIFSVLGVGAILIGIILKIVL